MKARAWLLGLALAASAVGCANLLGLDSTYQIPTCSVCGSDTCVDLQRDPAHCGVCTTACDSDELCSSGSCVPAELCTSGATEACYDGPAATESHTPCHGGTRTCTDSHWGACEGEQLPTTDVCGDGIDQDCDGTADNPVDLDGDGFTNCDGDCCDAPGQGCADPASINPGAYDFPGDGIDQDCDGTADDPPSTCDSGLASNETDALKYAFAMDLCQVVNPGARNPGVISADLTLVDGTSVPNPDQHSIRPTYGNTHVRTGASMMVLSTGVAAATGQTNPTAAAVDGTNDEGTTSQFPADWFAANGGHLPNEPGCMPDSGTMANDPVMLTLKLKVPTNAKSFSLSLDFLSAEFPEFDCVQAFTDRFLILLDSSWTGTPRNPADKNLAVYEGTHEINATLASDTTLFQSCMVPPAPCPQPASGSCTDPGSLVGTGMDVPSLSACATPAEAAGGGTGWLVARGNVVGGETITLRIALWDEGDTILDSVALIDGFQWSPDTITPGVTVQ